MATLRKRRLRSGRIVWQADYRDAGGHRRRLQRDSRAEAKAAAEELERNARQARPRVGQQDLTASAYATSWLEHIRKTISPRTHRSYAQVLRLYIVPLIGDEPLLALHEKVVGEILHTWMESGRSVNTVRLIRATLSAMCADAVDEGLLDRNPVPGAGGKRQRRAAAKQRRREQAKRIRPLSESQRHDFLKAARIDGTVYQALFSLMSESGGPRPDEALSLRWETVDLRNRTVEVWQTKTESWKTLDLAKRTVDLLRKLRAQAAQEALRSVNGALPELVFRNARGKKIDQSRLNRRLRAILKRAELPTAHSIYDLRHTWATIELAKGTPLTYVAAQLGHATPETTLRWYAHWIPGERPRPRATVRVAPRDARRGHNGAAP